MDERITSMIPHYGKLNKIYTEIMSGGSFSFEKQQFISGFYGEYGDTQTFETALISLMLEMDAAHFVPSINIIINSTKNPACLLFGLESHFEKVFWRLGNPLFTLLGYIIV